MWCPVLLLLPPNLPISLMSRFVISLCVKICMYGIVRAEGTESQGHDRTPATSEVILGLWKEGLKTSGSSGKDGDDARKRRRSKGDDRDEEMVSSLFPSCESVCIPFPLQSCPREKSTVKTLDMLTCSRCVAGSGGWQGPDLATPGKSPTRLGQWGQVGP
jgi:hypothetical protein